MTRSPVILRLPSCFRVGECNLRPTLSQLALPFTSSVILLAELLHNPPTVFRSLQVFTVSSALLCGMLLDPDWTTQVGRETPDTQTTPTPAHPHLPTVWLNGLCCGGAAEFRGLVSAVWLFYTFFIWFWWNMIVDCDCGFYFLFVETEIIAQIITADVICHVFS